ncbi:p25-alpha family protein [Cardiosporidium cionae]|uniref:P25-alpha family protein n=1 Tax=Cardiosporidium cionae TaxID=476202 RepID=A0ABQ7J6X7_9APIC|nr:p25-alpha family protein [Cardiosporidium cionae]|eukprot:KAF8819752.1 p25-alpha family protein [Cardiosporidium cionae]
MSLHDAFKAFTKNAPDMDGRTFVKILKDCKILDSKFTSVEADLTFAKVKTPGSKRIVYNQFQKALEVVAERKGEEHRTLCDKIAKEAVEGPILCGTKTEEVRFYDDKSTYTGVHRAGGPSTVDGGRTQFSDLSQITDRTPNNIRGVKKGVEEV